MGLLDNHVAVITGGGGGIGAASARLFADEGADVVVTGRRQAPLDIVVADVQDRGRRSFAATGDVSERRVAQRIADATIDAFGRIDILVNGAQVSAHAPVEELHPDDLETVFRGYKGTLWMMQSCFPHLRSSQGSVVNFGSSGAIRQDAIRVGAYAAAKDAIRSLTRVAAVEWGKHGIRVNALCPLAESPAFERWRERFPDAHDLLLSQVPLGRIGDCDADIAPTVLFLAGPHSRYVTGASLMVDGGQAFLG